MTSNRGAVNYVQNWSAALYADVSTHLLCINFRTRIAKLHLLRAPLIVCTTRYSCSKVRECSLAGDNTIKAFVLSMIKKNSFNLKIEHCTF